MWKALVVLTSRVLFHHQLPVALSEKDAEMRSAYTFKEGPMAPWEQHLDPHPAVRVWCLLHHGVEDMDSIAAIPGAGRSDVWLPAKGFGKAVRAYFSQKITLRDGGISSSEWPGHLPSA